MSGTVSAAFVAKSVRKVQDDASFEMAYPKTLSDKECEYLGDKARDMKIGVALSGGGIRSATFSLGVFQAIARQTGLLERIAFLSTVSGGGYFGTFLGCLFKRVPFLNKQKPNVSGVEEILCQQVAPNVVEHLRDNGNYLAPNGVADYMRIAAVYIRNLLAVNFILALSLLTLFFLAEAVDLFLTQRLGSPFFLREHFGCGIILSHWLLVPLLVFLSISVPLMLDFWLVREPCGFKRIAWSMSAVFTVGLLSLLSLRIFGTQLGGGGVSPAWQTSVSMFLVCCLIIMAIGSLIFTCLPFLVKEERNFGKPATRRKYRDWLEGRQAATLKVIVVLIALALIHSLGRTLYSLASYVGIGGILLSILYSAKAETFYDSVKEKFDSKFLSWLPKPSLQTLAGVAVPLLWLLSLDIAVNALVWSFGLPGDISTDGKGIAMAMGGNALPLFIAIAGMLFCLVVSFIVGFDLKFINLCSLNYFYKSRIEKAYLDASIPYEKPDASIPYEKPDASIPYEKPADFTASAKLVEYYGKGCGPAHLFNVTVNETVEVRSDGISMSRDRNGMGLSVGPCGLSLGVKHHLVFSAWGNRAQRDVFPSDAAQYYRIFEKFKDGAWSPDDVGAAGWASISGAAVAPGMGNQGDCLKSAVLTLGNIRLGYWWNTNVQPAQAECPMNWLFGMQRKLYAELCCAFKGPADSRWYLSDGGHFENLGGYELIRRRLPLIVLIDAEQDGDFKFSGLCGLMRKARADFGAELEFFDSADIANPSAIACDSIPKEFQSKFAALSNLSGIFGPLESLTPKKTQGGMLLSERHAALGRIRYLNAKGEAPKTSLLVYIKSSASGDEPLDLLSYKTGNPDFPHQNTGDQFFDETQWESYRKLGEHIADPVVKFIYDLTAVASVTSQTQQQP